MIIENGNTGTNFDPAIDKAMEALREGLKAIGANLERTAFLLVVCEQSEDADKPDNVRLASNCCKEDVQNLLVDLAHGGLEVLTMDIAFAVTNLILRKAGKAPLPPAVYYGVVQKVKALADGPDGAAAVAGVSVPKH